MNLKEIYNIAYAIDTLKTEINPEATTKGLWECIKAGGDVYEYIGVCDSWTRQNCFNIVSDTLNIDIDIIYNTYWG